MIAYQSLTLTKLNWSMKRADWSYLLLCIKSYKMLTIVVATKTRIYVKVESKFQKTAILSRTIRCSESNFLESNPGFVLSRLKEMINILMHTWGPHVFHGRRIIIKMKRGRVEIKLHSCIYVDQKI